MSAATISAKTIFKIDQKATIYYVVYNSDQGDLTPEDLKIEAGSSAANGQVITKSTVDIACNDIINEIEIEIEDLPAESTMFLYMVAESNSIDVILQTSVTKQTIETGERQPVMTFQSTAESREVLYLVYQPEEALKNPEELYPTIIFLGGNGEIAAQGQINLLRNGSLAEYISKGNDVPFIVISPQHIKGNWNADMVNEMIEEAKAKYPVDPDKVSLTGISGGGIGTWNYAVKYPEQLASIVPISGDGQDGQACTLINIPTWAFHNDPDGLVATNGSVSMVNAINACSPAPTVAAKLTLFEDAGHNAWRRVYDIKHPEWNNTTVEPIDIYAWLLEQSR